MRTKVLILGQGLCGTWLSYFLEQAGISYIVLDKTPGITSSRVASGVINPVTGRRLHKTWMAEQLLKAGLPADSESRFRGSRADS